MKTKILMALEVFAFCFGYYLSGAPLHRGQEIATTFVVLCLVLLGTFILFTSFKDL